MIAVVQATSGKADIDDLPLCFCCCDSPGIELIRVQQTGEETTGGCNECTGQALPKSIETLDFGKRRSRICQRLERVYSRTECLKRHEWEVMAAVPTAHVAQETIFYS